VDSVDDRRPGLRAPGQKRIDMHGVAIAGNGCESQLIGILKFTLRQPYQ
jgi:hypothetical protein